MSDEPCPFCPANLEPDRVVAASQHFVVLWSKFESALGHVLVVPKEHVADMFDLDLDDAQGRWYELFGLLHWSRDPIAKRYRDAGKPPPDGYNVGWNSGRAAGQTVMHAHVHVIPRVFGDVPDPRGGVRNVLPGGNYRANSPSPLHVPTPYVPCGHRRNNLPSDPVTCDRHHDHAGDHQSWGVYGVNTWTTASAQCVALSSKQTRCDLPKYHGGSHVASGSGEDPWSTRRLGACPARSPVWCGEVLCDKTVGHAGMHAFQSGDRVATW